jgi:hypothetical protein
LIEEVLIEEVLIEEVLIEEASVEQLTRSGQGYPQTVDKPV